MWSAQVILGLVYSAMVVVFTFGIPQHREDPIWGGQTVLHLAQAAVWVAGLCLIGLVIVVVPLGRGELWAWWTTVLVGLIVLGGYVGPYIRAHRPLPRADRIGVTVLAASFTVGLVVARVALNSVV
jgi:hypothetical protein